MVYEQLAWKDKFTEPTPHQLRQSLPESSVDLFDRTRRHLRRLDGVDETVAWYGLCWCWSIEYRTDQTGEPLAVLIPSPQDLQLAMPLDPEFITSLPTKRMKRAIRDGLDLAQEPFDTRWGVWSIQPGSFVDDLTDLVNRKLRHLERAAD
jgi:hypothetical protein